MKRPIRRALCILLLLICAAPLYAQGNSSRVYILVVDDFGDNFTRLSNSLAE